MNNISTQEPINQGSIKPMQFKRLKIEEIYMKDKLNEEWKTSKYPLPDNLRIGRNLALRLSIVEFVCCISSLAFYMRRRSRLILALIIFNFVFTCIGLQAKTKLSYWGLLIHATYTISVIGGFYIYIFIDYAMTSDQKTRSSASDDGTGEYKSMGQTVSMIITSFPMLMLFLMGIYSCTLAIWVEEELECRTIIENGGVHPDAEKKRHSRELSQIIKEAKKPKANKPNQAIELSDKTGDLDKEEHVVEVLDIEGVDEATCCICMDGPRNSVFYPCGHQVICKNCSERFKKEAKHQVCPICRNRVVDIIQVFSS